MTESCVFKPTVRNKEGKEVNSRLFDNLLHFSSNDREFAKKYYFIGTNDEFLRTNARYVEYDENGEITFKSLKNLVSLDISSEKIINQLNKDISSGEHEYGEAVSLMTSFNNNSPYNDEYMATISTVEGGKANLQVVRKTTANQTALEETLTNKSLFDRIKQAVERVGGSIDFIDEDYSKYDTVNAKKAESGLYNVIFLSRKKFYRRNSGSMEEYTKEEQEILKNASRDSQGRLLAPNGKPSNLTEKQYAQVRTRAFKRWFGDWERVAKSKLGNNIGDIDISEIINEDNSINFDKLEEITDKYFKTADSSLFKQNRETLRERKEHHDGETNTLEHLQNVVKTASELNIREDLKPTLVLAAALHDISKPFHGGQIHGYQSVDIINKLFKGNINNLVKFAIRHHMLTLDESKSFTQEDANRIIQDAKDNNLNINDAIDVLLALNTADIIRGRNLSVIDKYTNKSLINTINSEIPRKRLLLENATTNDVSKVVDENGEPLVVYHYTDNEGLTKFSTEFDNYFSKTGGTKKAIFFTTDNVVPGSEDNFLTSRKAKLSLFLNIKNLETFNGTKDDLHKQGTSYREVVNKSSEREGSENGIVFTGFDDNRKENQTIYIVHNPNQIKSATDNLGAFSSSEDDIYDPYTTVFTADMAEEAGHFAVGALGNNPLVKRLESLCTPEVQERILGEHYRDVQGRKNPRRETAGFLVGQYIMNEVDQESTLSRLAGRIVNLAKRMFYRLTLDDVGRMREEAKAIAKNIARGFMSGDNAGSIENALENKEILYSSVDSVPVSSFKDVIQQLNLLASEMSAVDKTLYRKWKDIEADTAIGRLFENPSFFADMAAIDGLSVALTQLADSIPEMIDMLDSVNYNPDEVPANAKKLRQVSLFVQESIAIMGIIDNMLTSNEVQLKEDARDALDKAYKNLSSLIKGANKLEVNLLKKERKLYLSFLKDMYGGEYVERAARVVFNFNKGKLERAAESREYLSKAMESLDKDDNFMNRYIASMADSSDIINQLAYKAKASANNFADENTIKAWNDIRALEQRVKKAKVDMKKLLEVSARDGKLTGNYISKYNWGDWENDWYEFKNKCKEDFLSDSSIEGKTQIEREYLWDVYFRPLAEDWHKSHSTYDQVTQKPMPNNSYRNHNYDRLTDTEKAALDDILELKGSLDDLLIYQSYNGEMVEAAHTHLYRMPQFRGSTQNRIENLKMTNPLGKAVSGAIRQNLINTFTITSEDRDYGSAMTHNTIDEDVFSDRLDFEKEKVKRVPLYGINKLKDMSELNTDIFSGLLQYAAMANTYVATSSVVDILETGRDVLANRRVKGLKREVERNKKSRVFGRYCDFLDAQVYNLYANSKLKFGQIALTKVIGFFGRLASKVFLGGNVAGGMVNVMTGFNEITKEAIAGEVYTLADLTKANALYFKYLPENWLEAGMGVKNNKVSLFMKMFNVQNNLDTETRNWSTRKSRLTRLNPFGNNLLFPYKSGDHYMQAMSYLAAANHYKFLDTNGETKETISLWDALEVKNIDDSNPEAGKTLEFKKGVLYIDPETNQTREWNRDDEVKFQNLCRETNNRMHGIYNRMDKTAFHNTWYGKAALAMRGYALGLLYRRFSSNQYSVSLGRESEGSLVTASKVFVNMFGGTKNVIPSLRALICPFGDSVKNSLLEMGFSVEQYRNMRRNWADFALISMLWILKALTAKSEDDDDDDDDTTSGLIYYFASRLYKEQNAYNTPWGIWQEQKSVLDWMPSGVSVAGQILDISRLMITQEEYKDSSATHEKGDKKWEYKVGSYIPYYRSIRVIKHPYEAAESYEYGRATYK